MLVIRHAYISKLNRDSYITSLHIYKSHPLCPPWLSRTSRISPINRISRPPRHSWTSWLSLWLPALQPPCQRIIEILSTHRPTRRRNTRRPKIIAMLRVSNHITKHFPRCRGVATSRGGSGGAHAGCKWFGGRG